MPQATVKMNAAMNANARVTWICFIRTPLQLAVDHEVPATVDAKGIHGVPMGQLPKGFAGLLNNQVAVHDLTAEAVITKSKSAALQALLVDPMVNNYNGIEEMLNTMIEYQERWLGYLK